MADYFTSSGVSYDAAAQAFFDAASITDGTQKTAVNQLVLDLKSAGVWPRMVAIYPFVGGTANSHKWNLRNPVDSDAANRLVFVDGTTAFTHSVNGSLPGASGYAKTFIDFNLQIPQYSLSWGVYNRTSASPIADEMLMGIGTGFQGPQIDIYSTNRLDAALHQTNAAGSTITTANTAMPGYTGLIGVSSYGPASVSIYRNATQLTENTTERFGYWDSTTSISGRTIYLWANNDNGVAKNFANREFAFAFVGYGLLPAEWSDLSSAVTAFQTTLGRNV